MTTENTTPRWGRLATFVLALLPPFAVAAIGGWITAQALDPWYANLVKPAWNPPAWLFGPVWTVLYLLMGIASWRVATSARPQPQIKSALRLYGLQLLFNLGWSALFFGLQQPFLGLLGIAVLLALVLGTARLFWRIDRLAGWVMIPYLAWTSFATILNLAIYLLNR